MKNIFKNNNGSTVILLTVLILMSVLVVTFTVGEIVKLGILKGRTQASSTKAYFAAETGAEKILWELRRTDGFAFDTTGCVSGDYFCFDSTSGDISSCDVSCTSPDVDSQTVSDAIYKITYQYNSGTLVTTLTSYGTYNDTTRVVELKY